MPTTEKVMLLEVYVQDGKIQTDTTDEIYRCYELLGFLECYLMNLKDELRDLIEKK